MTEFLRAGDQVRTGDIQLGRLTLYQLSYSRIFRLQIYSIFHINKIKNKIKF